MDKKHAIVYRTEETQRAALAKITQDLPLWTAQYLGHGYELWLSSHGKGERYAACLYFQNSMIKSWEDRVPTHEEIKELVLLDILEQSVL